MKFLSTRTTLSILPVALLLAACSPEESSSRASADTESAAIETAAAQATVEAAVRLDVLPAGNEVRYLVREQLAGFDLPNDAVGRTGAVAGGISFDESGRVIPGESEFAIQIGGLTSDKERRDGYVRRRILVADSNPTVVLKPTALRGMTLPLPAAGTRTLELVGNLTVKGVTRLTTWRVQATFAGDTVSGTAATAFTFGDFELAQPRVPVVLSVADTIRLEYDFRMAARE
jgi:polyisoprenoid-binding protein YceI